jgi:hypothetical protein
MDIAEIAKKVDALEAELAAKSSRIADLEARVSLLEAENTRLRNATRKGDAMDHTGKNAPTFGRLEENLGVNKQKQSTFQVGAWGMMLWRSLTARKRGWLFITTRGRARRRACLRSRLL